MAKFLKNLVGAVKDRLGKTNETDMEIADPTLDAFASQPISRAQAKLDLEARIAEKLAKMSGSNLEEQFILQQRQLQAKKKGEIAITSLEDLGLEAEIGFEQPTVEEPIADGSVDVLVTFDPKAEEFVFELKTEYEDEVAETELEFDSEVEAEAEPEVEVVEVSEVDEPEAEVEVELEAEEAEHDAHLAVEAKKPAVLKSEFKALIAKIQAKGENSKANFEEFLANLKAEKPIAEADVEFEAELEVEPAAELAEPEAEPIAEVDLESETELESVAEPETEEATFEDELTAKVDEFFKGFEENAEYTTKETKADKPEAEVAVKREAEEATPAVYDNFKERFLVGFDAFASGAMLESASKKCNATFRKLAARTSAIKNTVWLAIVKVFSVPAKPVVRFGTFISGRLKTSKEISHEKKRRQFKRRKFFIRGEQKVSNQMANFVTALDKGTGILARGFVKSVNRSSKRAHAVRDWADRHKKHLLTVLFVLMLCGITAVSIVNYFTAYIYAYNGKPLGMVKSQHDVLRVLDIVNTQLSREHGTYIEIDPERDLTFYRVISPTVNNEIDDMQDVFNRLTYMQDISTIAYAFYIDGRRIAVLDTEETIQTILSDYTNLFLLSAGMGTTVFEHIGFVEETYSRPIDTQLGRLNHASDILERIRVGVMTEKVHVVERGQTFNAIALMHGVTPDELHELNPTVTRARLSIGQELILQHAIPLLTIESVEVSTFIEPIPYENDYEDNPNMFVGERSVRIAGIPGERLVTARITRQNGLEMEREDLSHELISEPSRAVVVRGTRPVPPRQGTGQLRHPLAGQSFRMSSPFGMRWGRMHNGVDWAAARGTPVRAADGGTVTFSGYRGAMGNLIIIDHGGGIQTFYAHLNRRHVSAGTQVHQGQHIGDVGSTGRSTGPHLHFEVHVNGVPRNPMNFL